MFTYWKRYLFAWVFSLVVSGLSLAPGVLERVQSLSEAPMPEYKFEEDMATLVPAVNAYYDFHGEYPSEGFGLEDLAITGPDTPDELVRWARVVTACLLDPWGRPYFFVREAPKGPREFGIFSLGHDGESMSGGGDADDLNTWSGSQDYYIRLAERQLMNRVLLQWCLYGHLIFLFMAVVLSYIHRRIGKKYEPVFELLDD